MIYSTIIFYALMVGLTLYFSHACLSEAIASSYSPGKFKAYSNSDYMIRMLYATDWKVGEENLSPYQIVQFSAPEVKEKVTSLNTSFSFQQRSAYFQNLSKIAI